MIMPYIKPIIFCCNIDSVTVVSQTFCHNFLPEQTFVGKFSKNVWLVCTSLRKSFLIFFLTVFNSYNLFTEMLSWEPTRLGNLEGLEHRHL